MGHLTLLAEDVISALDRFPEDLASLIFNSYAPHPEWEDYVKGRYLETRRKDRLTLGGPKPATSLSSSAGSGPGGGGFGFDGEPGVSGVEARASFGGPGASAAGAGVGGGSGPGVTGGPGVSAAGSGRMAVDETAMFPGLRLDESNADTFAPRMSSGGGGGSGKGGAASRIEIEQGDIEGGDVINVGGFDRRADVPEDVGGPSRRYRSTSSNDNSGSNNSGGSGVRGEFRRVGFDGHDDEDDASRSRSASGRSVVAGVRNTADFGPPTRTDVGDEDEDTDEEKYGNSRTTHVSDHVFYCFDPGD